jgi:hypothetical protein
MRRRSIIAFLVQRDGLGLGIDNEGGQKTFLSALNVFHSALPDESIEKLFPCLAPLAQRSFMFSLFRVSLPALIYPKSTFFIVFI